MNRKHIIYLVALIPAVAFDWWAVHSGFYDANWKHWAYWAVVGGYCLWLFRSFFALVFWLPLFALLEDFIYQAVNSIQADGYTWMAVKFGKLGEVLSYDWLGWPSGYWIGAGWLIVMFWVMRKARYWRLKRRLRKLFSLKHKLGLDNPENVPSGMWAAGEKIKVK